MKTETQKTYRSGFALSEQELRRIVDVIVHQIDKLIPSESRQTRFELKLKSGAITETESLDDVLAIENGASKQIVRFSFTVSDKLVSPDKLIQVTFTNLRNDDSKHSISYKIVGESRDWVFVTASELDERIAVVKRVAVDVILTSRPPWSFFVTIASLMLPIFMFVGVYHALSVIERKPMTAVETAWKSGAIRDSTEAIVLWERENEEYRKEIEKSTPLLVRWSFIIPTAATILLMLAGPLVFYLHPAYTFTWGDYVRVIEQRIQIRRFVYSTVVLGLIVGVAASLIANKLSK